jgi:mono/diheme cytochrome c family protein
MSAASRSKRGWLLAVLMVLAAIAAAGAVAVYTGLYNVAADIPHTQPVYWLLQKARERSIAVRATDITVPSDLGDTRRIGSGAGQYAEMCASCHLAPGMKRTEIARGLNPRAPELRRKRRSTPAEDFWVVKHGVKMTGMPAWGLTHDDEILWDLVAFLQKLPELSPDQYRSLVKSAPRTHEEMMHEPSAEEAAGDQSHH